jgi:hypothetical protein
MTLEIFSRSLKKGQVEAVVMGEWSKGPFLGAMTMFPDSETEIMQPEEAPKALGIFSRSLEEGNVEGNVGSSSKGPPKRPSRKDSVHDEQRPRLKRSSSEDHATQKFRKRDSTIVPFQSPVHENGGFYTEVVQWGTTSVHTKVERKYTEVAARRTPVYFRGNC